MPYHRRRDRRRHQQRWRDALERALESVRRKMGFAPGEVLPDAVLLAEAEHHFSPGGMRPPTQWFGFCLVGFGETEAERAQLALRLRGLSGGPVPWGLLDMRSRHRSRRGVHFESRPSLPTPARAPERLLTFSP